MSARAIPLVASTLSLAAASGLGACGQETSAPVASTTAAVAGSPSAKRTDSVGFVVRATFPLDTVYSWIDHW